MATVRAFDAALSELEAFEGYMSKYLHFTTKASVAYFGYATVSTSLPELVFAIVGTIRLSAFFVIRSTSHFCTALLRLVEQSFTVGCWLETGI
jgi:hypothetical protein